MRQLSRVSMLEVWYTHLKVDELLPEFQSLLDPTRTPSVWHAVTKARGHDSLHAFDKLCEIVEGSARIRSDPPLVTPVEELVLEADGVDLVGTSMDAIIWVSTRGPSTTIAVTCSSSTGFVTSHARSSGSGALAPTAGSC